MPSFRRFLLAPAVAALALLAAPRTGSAQDYYSTGANVLGGIDQNWWVSTGFGAWNTNPAAFIPASIVVASPYPPTWAPPSGPPQLNWISNLPSGTNGAPPWFIFRQTFDLTGYDLSTASLRFYWGCDDVPWGDGSVITPYMILNGAPTPFGGGTCGGYNIYGGSLVDITSATPGGLNPGLNYLDFYVRGNGTTDGMGLNVESFSAEPLSTVPEPATLMLLGTGMFGVLGAAWRRRKHNS